MTDYKTLNYSDVSVGDKLPSLDVDITSGLIVSTALATRDYDPVHHDKSVAQAAGLPPPAIFQLATTACLPPVPTSPMQTGMTSTIEQNRWDRLKL